MVTIGGNFGGALLLQSTLADGLLHWTLNTMGEDENEDENDDEEEEEDDEDEDDDEDDDEDEDEDEGDGEDVGLAGQVFVPIVDDGWGASTTCCIAACCRDAPRLTLLRCCGNTEACIDCMEEHVRRSQDWVCPMCRGDLRVDG